ncbi:MAG: hypothetical protein COV70_03500 [Parcubacteria group bacterium CG11_big_fil_rev_8_21_14_0_20_39_22]|nr:MAG: hypothetical protein COV70_03500 [Parcubacteria group bacterium CG11_big_fil_rev_8_21_14_0_20_39_22]
MNKIIVRFNVFGPYIEKKDIPKIIDSKFADAIFQHQRELFNQFFELPFSALSKEILERYAEATTEESHTAIVPHTKEISERLLKPLHSAKKCYCLGDYAATIALCGMVGEMLAILLWKINDVRLKGNSITEQDEIGIFGSSFENLGQDKRLKVLKTFGHITETQLNNFDTIRRSRKPYLHLWTTDLKNEQADALDVFKKSFQLFKEITGIGLADAQTVKINPLLMKLFENLETTD